MKHHLLPLFLGGVVVILGLLLFPGPDRRAKQQRSETADEGQPPSTRTVAYYPHSVPTTLTVTEPSRHAVEPSDPAAPELVSRKRPARSEGRMDENTLHDRAPDYSWLMGELRYVHVRRAWCLRYGDADESDRYGGSVTLVGLPDMNSFRSGQLVRAEGELLDPDSREPSPAYRVHSLQRIKPR